MARPSPVSDGGEVPDGHVPDARSPCRRIYLFVGLGVAAIAVYGSLVPFDYRPLSLHEALDRVRQLPYPSLATGGRADLAANVLLFVPIGYCWLGALVAGRRSAARTALFLPLVALAALALSAALEFSQLWFPPRVVSWRDVVAQAAGNGLGMGLWLMIGQTLNDWVQSPAERAAPRGYIGWLLWAYFSGLVIYRLQPLDLTISVTDLVHKYREGRIELVPWSHGFAGGTHLYAALFNAATFVPVGVLAATWLVRAGRPVRSLWTSALLGAMAVAAVELGQLFVSRCPTSTADLITGTLGVVAGAWLARRWHRGTPNEETPPEMRSSARRAWLRFVAAGAYALAIAALLCVPFEVTRDLEEIKARYEGFVGIPFAGLARGSHLDAVLDVLKKVLFFAPLGALLALAAAPLSVPRPVRRILLGALLVAVGAFGASIEMAQLFLLPHTPNVTDVILYTTGAALGMAVTCRLVGSRGEPSLTAA